RAASARFLAALAERARAGFPVEEDEGPLPLVARWPEVVAVLEGQARGAGPADGVTIVEAATDGDAAVVAETRRLTDAGRRVRVVTADRGLAARVAELGAETIGPRRLLDQLG
ncbi:MAG: 8-oxo-dGTP diphosphatase, partial [Microbacteriaceae bacterium]|nr:8-oxo-dGTP diphosphatase [Microbacteriaceae bacterium]